MSKLAKRVVFVAGMEMIAASAAAQTTPTPPPTQNAGGRADIGARGDFAKTPVLNVVPARPRYAAIAAELQHDVEFWPVRSIDRQGCSDQGIGADAGVADRASDNRSWGRPRRMQSAACAHQVTNPRQPCRRRLSQGSKIGALASLGLRRAGRFPGGRGQVQSVRARRSGNGAGHRLPRGGPTLGCGQGAGRATRSPDEAKQMDVLFHDAPTCGRERPSNLSRSFLRAFIAESLYRYATFRAGEKR